MVRLLLVEDDEAIAVPLLRTLRREGLDCDHSATGVGALERLEAASFDAVILDLGLPDVDGIEVCQRARSAHPELPVLVLTARSSELDEVLGLEVGASDYVTKPFSTRVLLARLRALLRRREPHGTTTWADVRVDGDARRAWRGDRELELSPKSFDLLAVLAANAGRAVRRDDIMARVWSATWWGPTKTLDVHIGWLRKELGDPPLITTVRGYGYRLEG